MADTTLTGTQRAAHAKTLTANTVETVTFPVHHAEVEVLSHDGVAAIYYTLDGSTPTVGGTNTFVLPAAISRRVERAPETRIIGGEAAVTVVKLKSAGTPTYSVTAV